jgi:hypothetical protein
MILNVMSHLSPKGLEWPLKSVGRTIVIDHCERLNKTVFVLMPLVRAEVTLGN